MIETICALSTPNGRAALAIIRLSGPEALEVVREMGADDLQPRVAKLSVLKDHKNQPIDECLVTFFQSPNSYTGEDLVEISAHGNPVIVEKIIGEIVSRETVRLAEPGEFTRRALANKRLSFDQVESLDWVLNASSIEGVRRGLVAKLEGLGGSANLVSSAFMDLIADLQAQLDFADSDVGSANLTEIAANFKKITAELEAWVNNYQKSQYLFGKWTVVLAGPPNSGKSSLFNRLIGLEKAIVYDQPGTTRDFIEHFLVLDGFDVLLMDTAGIRRNPEPIEAIGIEKTKEAMARADVILWVDERGERPPEDLAASFRSKKWVYIRSKSDLGSSLSIPQLISVSATTGDGVNEVKSRIVPEKAEETHLTPLTSARQMALVQSAIAHLKAATTDLESGQYLDMVTEQALMGARAIGAIVEPPNNEDVLKSIFGRFCIGK